VSAASTRSVLTKKSAGPRDLRVVRPHKPILRRDLVSSPASLRNELQVSSFAVIQSEPKPYASEPCHLERSERPMHLARSPILSAKHRSTTDLLRPSFLQRVASGQQISLQALVTPSTTIMKDGRPLTFALYEPYSKADQENAIVPFGLNFSPFCPGSRPSGTQFENDCLSWPQQRVLLGSARGADIYCCS
jgi:hypothetical protein